MFDTRRSIGRALTPRRDILRKNQGFTHQSLSLADLQAVANIPAVGRLGRGEIAALAPARKMRIECCRSWLIRKRLRCNDIVVRDLQTEAAARIWIVRRAMIANMGDLARWLWGKSTSRRIMPSLQPLTDVRRRRNRGNGAARCSQNRRTAVSLWEGRAWVTLAHGQGGACL
jgi:hypothetical protein